MNSEYSDGIDDENDDGIDDTIFSTNQLIIN